MGVPSKNIRELGGKPLYRWILDTSVASGLFDKIIITTNINDILETEFDPVVEKQVRPCDLAEDVMMKFIVKHVLDQYDEKPDAFALLQPTSPFLRTLDIKLCKEALEQHECAASSQTVIGVPHHHHAYNQRVVRNGWLEFAFPDKRKDVRRQNQPKHYALGNLIMTRTGYFMRTGDFFGMSVGVLIPLIYGMDIDTVEDLGLAELLTHAKLRL